VKVDGLAEKTKLKDAAGRLQAAGKNMEAANYWAKVIDLDPTDGDAYIGMCHLAAEAQRGFRADHPQVLATEQWKKNHNLFMARQYASKDKLAPIEKIVAEDIAADQSKIRAKERAERVNGRRGAGFLLGLLTFLGMMIVIGLVMAGLVGQASGQPIAIAVIIWFGGIAFAIFAANKVYNAYVNKVD
jgi:hypothetical protein